MPEQASTPVSGRPVTTAGRPVRPFVPRRRASDLSSYDCSDLSEQSGLDIVKDCLEPRQPGLPKALIPYVADVCRLPFEDGMFHAVGVDRTLQHVVDLERAIGEMARVVAAGLTNIEVYPEALMLTDLNSANEVLHIGRTLRDCVLKGLLDESTARRWFDELRIRDNQGQYFSSLTLFLARGRKPLHRPQVFERFLQNLTGIQYE